MIFLFCILFSPAGLLSCQIHFVCLFVSFLFESSFKYWLLYLKCMVTDPICFHYSTPSEYRTDVVAKWVVNDTSATIVTLTSISSLLSSSIHLTSVRCHSFLIISFVSSISPYHAIPSFPARPPAFTFILP